jgi:hypothetical protein
MLRDCLVLQENRRHQTSDLLKIKHLQSGLKLQLAKLLDCEATRSEAVFGGREILHSRVTVQRQLRFPAFQRKSQDRLVPSSTQVLSVKSSLVNDRQSGSGTVAV